MEANKPLREWKLAEFKSVYLSKLDAYIKRIEESVAFLETVEQDGYQHFSAAGINRKLAKMRKRSIADWYKLWDRLNDPNARLSKEERDIVKAAKIWKVAKDHGKDQVLLWKLTNV